MKKGLLSEILKYELKGKIDEDKNWGGYKGRNEKEVCLDVRYMDIGIIIMNAMIMGSKELIK